MAQRTVRTGVLYPPLQDFVFKFLVLILDHIDDKNWILVKSNIMMQFFADNLKLSACLVFILLQPNLTTTYPNPCNMVVCM